MWTRARAPLALIIVAAAVAACVPAAQAAKP